MPGGVQAGADRQPLRMPVLGVARADLPDPRAVLRPGAGLARDAQPSRSLQPLAAPAGAGLRGNRHGATEERQGVGGRMNEQTTEWPKDE